MKVLKSGVREEIVQMKGVRAKEGALRRRRREVIVNDLKFVIGKFDKVLKFSGKGRNGLNDRRNIVIVRIQKMKKAEGDVSGGLNDSLDDLIDVIMFQCNQMTAPNGLLESIQWHDIGNKSLASIEIDVDAVNKEARSIMKSQMRNG